MGRNATLTPTYQRSKNRWLLSLPPRLSPSGSRSQEYFKTKKEAETRSASLKKLNKQSQTLAAKASAELIRDAVELDELAQFYGFSGLRQAFMAWSKDHERKSTSASFRELLEAYEADYLGNWTPRYQSGRWKPFRNKVRDLEPVTISLMDSDYWRAWCAKWREQSSPAPATFNQTVGMIQSLFGHEKARGVHDFNPLESIPRQKDVRAEVCVAPPEEVKALLAWCQENDPELIPYFTIGFFAGMRPQSEILPMTFEQINFAEKIIDCVTTKTARNPRRQIPIEHNLFAWLKGFADKTGSVIPVNFTKRHNKAKSESGITWGHDIMRHSYGSYFEVLNRGKAGCRESLSYNMGHTSFKTYEQKYRNGKVTPSLGNDFWAIKP